MKRLGIVAWGFTLMCAAGVCTAETFRAGAAQGNITPELGGDIIGGYQRRPATHVHDDLWVRCLVLDDGTSRVALAVCDLLGVSRFVSDEARRMVQEETGLPAGHVLVSGTHTHSAISALGDRYLIRPETNDYQRFVARRIADTVRCAINNLAPAQIGWATANEPNHVFNRRWHLKPGTVPVTPFGVTNELVKMNPGRANPNLVKPAGPTDPEICLLAVRTPEGRPVALFANYSLHYVGGVRGAAISADYYGFYNDRMQQLLGADRQDPPFVSIMSNGTSGDINNVDVTRADPRAWAPYERMRVVANDVAQKTFEAYQTIRWRDHAKLGAAFEEIELRYRRPTPEQLAFAKAILAKRVSEDAVETQGEIYAARTVRVNESPESGRFALQAFRIGEVGIATLPNEVLCEIGLELKRRSPFKPSFVVSLAHGYFGYLPTPEQHALGGYETWLTSSRFEDEAAPKMIGQLLGMLGRLQQAK